MGSPSPEKSFTVAIVGGGLAGLSLARGLTRNGIRCQVFEGAPAYPPVGAGLSFAVNSIEALRLVDQESYQKFLDRCDDLSEKKDVYMTYRDGRTDEAKIITTLICKGTGQQAVHRTLLVKDMASLMPNGTVHMGKSLESLVENTNGDYTLKFEDGSEFFADAVVGADGIRSKTRVMMLGKDNSESYPKYAGEFGYRSLVPIEEACTVLGESFAKNGNVCIADGLLTTTYPVEKGTMLNVIAAREQREWKDPSWILPADEETVREEFKNTGEPMRKIVSLVRKPQKWSLWHHPETSTFCRGRLALIGDAAHASTPHQGAGAGNAFEDALVLSRLLADDSIQKPQDIGKAFEVFDTIRRPRTLRVVSTSRENGSICMMRGENVGEDLDAIKQNLETRFHWIWYKDLEGHVEEALAELRKVNGKAGNQEPLDVSSPSSTTRRPSKSQVFKHGLRDTRLQMIYMKLVSWFPLSKSTRDFAQDKLVS